EDFQGGRVELSGGDLLDQSISAVFGQKSDKGSFLVSGRLQRGQLPTGFWFEDNDSEVEGSDLYIKGKYGNFEASYYRHEDDTEGFNFPLGFIPGASFNSAETISQTVDIFAFKSSHELRQDLTFSTDFSYAQREGSRCSSCHAAAQNSAFADTVDHGYQLSGDIRLGLRMIPNHDILIGIEARRVDAGDQTDQLLQPSATQDVVLAYTKIAGYIQDQISLADDRLRLTLGARFDGSNDLFDSELSPRIAAVYTPSERVVLRGGWSSAFRFPNFNELYQDSWFLGADFGFFAFPLQVFSPNPDLQPEEIRTFDLGAEFSLNPSLKLKVDLFHSELRDFIVMAFLEREVGPTEVLFENHPDDATLMGGEIELRWQAGRKFSGLFNYSYQEADQDGNLVDSSGKRFEFVYAPENKANIAAYFGPFAGFRATIEAQWRDEREGPSFWNFAAGQSRTAILDAYTLLNARLSWDAPVRIGRSSEGLRLSVYGKNLLDEDEIDETFLPINQHLPGRTFYGAIEIRY
ncbi:MAG: TonB-dependent receptor, partial [Acidobacteriota bacterium]